MALRGKKPTEIQKRLKALFYGAAGVGKTTAAINFPSPYLIDTERGAENSQYIKILEKNNGAVFQTYDLDELIQEVVSLLSTKHHYKTLIIDPLSMLYNDLVDKEEEKLKRLGNGKGTEFAKHYREANKKIRHLINLLFRLDMNVIITSHSKDKYGSNMTVLGQTFDCYKKLDYLFDLVFEVQKRGKERVGVVIKTREESFPEGEVFPFSYQEIANRYGAHLLEKEMSIEELATDEQLDELYRLIELLNVPSETIEKWLSKANAETFAEMNTAAAQKIIDYLVEKTRRKVEEVL